LRPEATYSFARSTICPYFSSPKSSLNASRSDTQPCNTNPSTLGLPALPLPTAYSMQSWEPVECPIIITFLSFALSPRLLKYSTHCPSSLASLFNELVPNPVNDEKSNTSTRLHVCGRDCARMRGYDTVRSPSPSPPTHNRMFCGLDTEVEEEAWACSKATRRFV